MSLFILSAEVVDAIVKAAPPEELLQLMGKVFFSLTSPAVIHTGEVNPVQLPHRISLTLPNHTSLFMPSRILTAGGSAMKVVSVPRGDSADGLPATTLVLDEKTGGVRAVVNARSLTAVRTAAGSALAVRCIGPSNPTSLVLFGAGLQMYHHAAILLKLYSSLHQCAVINRSQNTRLQSTVGQLSKDFPHVTFETAASSEGGKSSRIEQAVRSADIICSATSSIAPLYDSAWVKPGACIVLVGSYKPTMHEISATLVRRAGKVVVDSRAACLSEAGELISAGLGEGDLVELGELVDAEGRLIEAKREAVVDGGDVTMFKSVGVGVQDVAIAALVVEMAEKAGLGTRVDYD